ncbi:hypothetical protein Tco_0608056 [Tanacetum coccineum]
MYILSALGIEYLIYDIIHFTIFININRDPSSLVQKYIIPSVPDMEYLVGTRSDDFTFLLSFHPSLLLLSLPFGLSSLPHVEHLLVEDMLEALMVSENGAFCSIEAMSPNLQGKNYGSKFQVVRPVILHMLLELSRCLCDDFIPLH